MENEEVRKYSRWFWLGIWATVINIVLMLAFMGAGIIVGGAGFFLLGRTRLALGISVIISVLFIVFSFIAQGWGEDWAQDQVRPRGGKTDTASLLVAVVVVVLVLGAVGARMRATGGGTGDGGFLGIQIPDIILNLIVPESGGSDGSDWGPPPDWGDPPANKQAPTGITATVSPSTIDMGDWLIGTVTSNGYNWPLSVTVTHTGSGVSGELAGWLGPDGQFEIYQSVEVPGVYEVTATANGITDGPITFVVRGILVDCDGGFYSKTLSDSKRIGVYSHHTNQNAGIVGHYPAHSISRPITNTVINAGGYGEVAPNLDSLNNGDWELDAIIGGDSATAWEGTYWVRVGR
jgi:hypothetical protein